MTIQDEYTNRTDLTSHQKHYQRNRENRTAKAREKYLENPEKHRERSKKYNSEHREERCMYYKEWLKNNPTYPRDYLDAHMQERRDYFMKQYYGDIEFREKERIRKNSYHKAKQLDLINKCEICGSTEALQIHHKDYTTNPEDWQILCMEHHLKLHKET